MTTIAHILSLALPAAWLGAQLLGPATRPYRRRLLWCLLLVVALSVMPVDQLWHIIGSIILLLAILGIGIPAILTVRGQARRWVEEASVAPLVLRSPFADAWRVQSGGPVPFRNHHLRVSDQRFAYDFLRVSGTEWESPIYAPCEGTVAHVEDNHPDCAPDESKTDYVNVFGNYVSIETPYGYVMLCHLREGSIAVTPGLRVGAGDFIGKCGNSGNTTRSHLHLHAQDRSTMSIDTANGVPVRFLIEGEPRVLRAGAVLPAAHSAVRAHDEDGGAGTNTPATA